MRAFVGVHMYCVYLPRLVRHIHPSHVRGVLQMHSGCGDQHLFFSLSMWDYSYVPLFGPRGRGGGWRSL